MAKRFTEPEKWNDKWFRNLNPLEKICFIFICDRCDWAGFYELDIEDMAYKIKAPVEDVLVAVQGLRRGFVGAKDKVEDGTVIWIRKFIYHQKNLPLNPSNNAHKNIINCINNHPEFLGKIVQELGADQGLFSPLGKVKVKVKVDSSLKTKNNIIIGNTIDFSEIDKRFEGEKFEKAWDNFIEFRKKIKKAIISEDSEKRILESLSKIGDDPVDVIHQSIDNSWQGLFALKNKNNGSESKKEEIDRLAKEWKDFL